MHGGGRDLIFPHHENEIAQSEAAGLPFAKVWMHNGMIRSDGEKMAKSVGNIFLLREVLDRYDPAVVLMYFLTTHYRSPLEFSRTSWTRRRPPTAASPRRSPTSTSAWPMPARRRQRGECPDLALRAEAARVAFGEHMDDDLNTAGAIGELFGLVGEMYRYLTQVDRGELPLDTDALGGRGRTSCASRLGALLIPVPGAGAGLTGAGTVAGDEADACVTGGVALLPAARLAEEGRWDDVALVYADRLGCEDASYACVLRDHYRAEKQWADADRLRDEIQAAGFEVRDTPQGTQVVRK